MRISIIDGNKGQFKPIEVKDLKELSNVITMKGYSLGTFQNNHRTNENFQGSHFVGLDFDGGMTLEEAKIAFKDYQHIIATTRNHQNEKNGIVCDRFRVILKADEFINNQYDYKSTVLELMKQYPNADTACSDAARFFYESKEVQSFNSSGKSIPVIKYKKPELVKTKIDEFLKGEVSKSTLEFISFGAKSGVWNERLFKAAIDLHEQGYSKEEAIELLTKATIGFDGELDSKDLTTIDSAYNKEAEYSPRGSDNILDLKHPLKLSANSNPTEWLVDGIFQSGGISIMAGAPKSGKSTLTRQLAISVCRGADFLGRKTKKGKVIYLALEENEGMVVDQFKHLGITDEDPMLIKVGPILQENPAQLLEKSIKASNADLVVIDTMLLMTRIDDINSYTQVYKALNPYRNIARETGVHIIMIHHKNKGFSTKADSAAGSVALSAAVDCTFILNETNNHDFRFVNTSQRGGKPFKDQKIKYISELDIYEITNETYVGDF